MFTCQKLTCRKIKLYKCQFCSIVTFMKLNSGQTFEKFMKTVTPLFQLYDFKTHLLQCSLIY